MIKGVLLIDMSSLNLMSYYGVCYKNMSYPVLPNVKMQTLMG
jgi:hypothetical protein